MTNSIFLRILCILTITIALSSCGSSSNVDDVQVKTEYVDNDLYISIGANLNMGNLMLPQTTLPIYMPKTWKEIGTISMTSAIGGVNYMEIDVNLSAVANLQTTFATLPNGSVLPLIAGNKVIEIPVGKGAVLYLTIADGVAAIGTAIPIKTFDAMGAKIGTTSLFPIFNVNNVLGAAGIFTSKEPGKNGLGFFADVSSLLNPVDFIDLGQAVSSTRMLRSAKAEFRPSQVKLDFSSLKPSDKKHKRLNKELYKLGKRRRRLRLY